MPACPCRQIGASNESVSANARAARIFARKTLNSGERRFAVRFRPVILGQDRGALGFPQMEASTILPAFGGVPGFESKENDEKSACQDRCIK